jgi:hypothetical protein
MDLARYGNLIEAVVWFILALVLFFYAFRREKRLRLTLWLLAVVIIAFGVSDLVEARTGAWWKPWWLFVWKALCVITLLLGSWRYRRLCKADSLAGNDAKS